MDVAERKPGSFPDDRRTRGAVLAEFALIGFLVWLLLAGILEIGRALTVQQQLQHAARTITREMARLPLPPDISFAAALERTEFRAQVLDLGFLVIDSGLLARCGVPNFGEAGHEQALDALFAARPIGNRLLRPLMIWDRRGADQMIRYPGALLLRSGIPFASCEDGSRYGVGIAEVESATGTVRWHGVVEPHGTSVVALRAFPLASGGWVGLRLNYPFQSAGLIAAESTGVIDPQTGRETQRLVDAGRVLVDDEASLNALSGTLAPVAGDGGVYAGPRGLGRLYSLPDETGEPRAVRPFRRLLSASAGFRREIFL